MIWLVVVELSKQLILFILYNYPNIALILAWIAILVALLSKVIFAITLLIIFYVVFSSLILEISKDDESEIKRNRIGSIDKDRIVVSAYKNMCTNNHIENNQKVITRLYQIAVCEAMIMVVGYHLAKLLLSI